MKKLILIFLTFVLLISGCNSNSKLKEVSNDNTSERRVEPIKSPNSQGLKGSSQTTLTNLKDSETPRAVGKAVSGEILIIPTEADSIEQLGAPSCLGTETDYSFKGNYKIVFKDLKGHTADISYYNGQIIAKDKSPISLGKLRFKDIEIFYFKPIPNLSRPESVYIFGVDKNGKAFQLLFEYPDKVVESTASSPNSIPQIIDNLLVISTWDPEEGNYKLFFELDTQKNALKFIKKEKGGL